MTATQLITAGKAWTPGSSSSARSAIMASLLALAWAVSVEIFE